MDTVYHIGELELQEKFGGLAMASRAGQVIKDKILKGAIPFIENQPFVIFSSMDESGNIWTSLVLGEAGWMDAKEEGHIRFFSDKIYSPDSEIFFENIKINDQVGMIVIELGTRRRYRINGRIQTDRSNFDLIIEEAYPNCPKYIQRRIRAFHNIEKKRSSSMSGLLLSEEQKE